MCVCIQLGNWTEEGSIRGKADFRNELWNFALSFVNLAFSENNEYIFCILDWLKHCKKGHIASLVRPYKSSYSYGSFPHENDIKIFENGSSRIS